MPVGSNRRGRTHYPWSGFDDNDYSVPVCYATMRSSIKGYVDRVVLCHQDKIVAEHSRTWGKERYLFDHLHYLPLLERKPGSLDYARPLAGLDLPECFDTLRRRLQGQEEKKGKGSGNLSGSYDSWRTTPWSGFESPSRKLCRSRPIAGMPSCSS